MCKETIYKLQDVVRLLQDADNNITDMTINPDDTIAYDNYNFWMEKAQETLKWIITDLINEYESQECEAFN